MKQFEIVSKTSMYKALTHQHEAVTRRNKLNIISNDLSGY